METYYGVLGVSQTATEEDIKSAYRKIALKYHPDKHSGLDDMFRKATEAYDVLQNSQKRKQYDQELQPVKLAHGARIRKGSDIRATVMLKAEEIVNETTKDILITRQVHCLTCKGTGASTACNILCRGCNGTGIDLVSSVIGPQRFCIECKGYGSVPENNNCSFCQGQGLVTEQKIEHLKITRNFNPISVILGSGNCMRGGGVAGNLIISLGLERSNTLKVEGKNIRGILRISPALAVLGGSVSVDVFGTLEKIVIPPRTRPGVTIEKKDAGVIRGKTKGFLILKIYYDIPKLLSEKEEDLYKQLLNLQKGQNP